MLKENSPRIIKSKSEASLPVVVLRILSASRKVLSEQGFVRSKLYVWELHWKLSVDSLCASVSVSAGLVIRLFLKIFSKMFPHLTKFPRESYLKILVLSLAEIQYW